MPLPTRPLRLSPGGGLLILLVVLATVAVACMGGGAGSPTFPPPGDVGRGAPPPISATVQSVSVPPGGGFLLGPTPYITALSPPHNSYQTVLPFEATAQVDDHLEGGVEMYTALLDGGVVAGVTLGTDGILHIPLPSTALPGAHWIQVAVRDTYGNHNEHGWAFFYQPAPPLMVEMGVDGSRTDALWVLLETFPALAEAGDPANWLLTDPLTGLPLPTQVASVSQLRQMPMLSLTLTADVPDPPWLLTLSWNGQSQTYGMGWGVLQQGAGLPAGGGGGGGMAPLPGPMPLPGPGGGGAFPDGPGDWDWWDLPWPMTPRDPCDCEPYPGPPLCPPDPADRTPPIPGGLFMPPGICTDPDNCGGFTPPDPEGEPELYISAREPSQEGDHPTWCAQLAAPRTVWYEHFLENEIMLWDMDLTQDLSTPVWEHEPNIPLRSDDPGGNHTGHPSSPLAWNIIENQNQGTPWGTQIPLMHEWPRTGQATRHSRIYAPAAPLDPVWPWEIHETSTPDITHTTGEESHPTFEAEGLDQTPHVITGEERRALTPSGDAYGTDWYKTATIADPASDHFVMVRGKDNPGILAYEMPSTPFFALGDRAPLTYARGDRAFLSEVLDAQTGTRVMDVLLAGGFAKLKAEYPDKYEEALQKVCDWGRVSATYMIDNPPPGSVPPLYQGKWSGNPGGDPDWSAIYEEAVWFVPVKKGVCCEEPETRWPVWVKLQDDQGNWRLASPSNWDDVISAEDQILAATLASISTMTHVAGYADAGFAGRQYVNLHQRLGLTHDNLDWDQVLGIWSPTGECLDFGTNETELNKPFDRRSPWVCLEATISGLSLTAPIDLRVHWQWIDVSYQPPNLNWQNRGVECDFGLKDDPDHPQGILVDCTQGPNGNWTPKPPLPGSPPGMSYCDSRAPAADDPWSVGQSPLCDNREPVGIGWLPGNGSYPLEWYCDASSATCNLTNYAHIGGYNGGLQTGGDNFVFRAQCLCRPKDELAQGARFEPTPAIWSEAVTVWRALWVRPDKAKEVYQGVLWTATEAWGKGIAGEVWADAHFELTSSGQSNTETMTTDASPICRYNLFGVQDVAHDMNYGFQAGFHPNGVSGAGSTVPPQHWLHELNFYRGGGGTQGLVFDDTGSACGPGPGTYDPKRDFHYGTGTWMLDNLPSGAECSGNYCWKTVSAHEIGHILLKWLHPTGGDPACDWSKPIDQTLMYKTCYDQAALRPVGTPAPTWVSATEIIQVRTNPDR